MTIEINVAIISSLAPRPITGHGLYKTYKRFWPIPMRVRAKHCFNWQSPKYTNYFTYIVFGGNLIFLLMLCFYLVCVTPCGSQLDLLCSREVISHQSKFITKLFVIYLANRCIKLPNYFDFYATNQKLHIRSSVSLLAIVLTVFWKVFYYVNSINLNPIIYLSKFSVIT